LPKPLGLTSFIQNVTRVSAYRSELHTDLQRSFERFAVEPASARSVCKIMQDLSVLARSDAPAGDLAEIEASLLAMSRILFERHVREQFETQAIWPRDPEPEWFSPPESAPESWLLLDYVYAYCHADDGTVATLAQGLGAWIANQNALGLAVPSDIAVALEDLRARPPAARRNLDVLCSVLAWEYGRAGWQSCW